MENNVQINFDIVETTLVGDELIVSGMANPVTIDRLKEIMLPECWDLTNYEKNPIILFNHKKNKPIGRALEVKVTDAGLYVKCRISKSKNSFIQYVRDLIVERILNCFSIGFLCHEEHDDRGIRVVTKVDLFEISIVAVPMNPDATFVISEKEMNNMEYKHLVATMLERKGADKALLARAKMYEEGLEISDIVPRLVKSLNLKIIEAKDFLAGNRDMSDADFKTICKIIEERKDMAVMEEENNENPKDVSKDVSPEDNIQGSSKPKFEYEPEIQSILIPKEKAKTNDEALKLAQEMGLEPLEILDENDGFIAVLRDKTDFKSELVNMAIEDSLYALVGFVKEIEDGSSRDMSIGEEGINENKDTSNSVQDTEDLKDSKSMKAKKDELRQKFLNFARTASLAIDEKMSYDLVNDLMAVYEKKYMIEGKPVVESDKNPIQNNGEQMIILLGTLINEVQCLKAQAYDFMDYMKNTPRNDNTNAQPQVFETSLVTTPMSEIKELSELKERLISHNEKMRQSLKMLGI